VIETDVTSCHQAQRETKAAAVSFFPIDSELWEFALLFMVLSDYVLLLIGLAMIADRVGPLRISLRGLLSGVTLVAIHMGIIAALMSSPSD
jgi:hypothetical protein